MSGAAAQTKDRPVVVSGGMGTETTDDRSPGDRTAISVYLSPARRERVRMAAARRGISMSRWLYDLIDHELAAAEDDPDNRRPT